MPDGNRGERDTELLVPAIEVAVIVTSADRQIQLKTHMVQTTPDDEANAIVDKLYRMGDRQKARYDLEAEMEGLNKVAVTCTALIAGLPIATANFIEAHEKRVAEFQGFEADYQKLHDEGYAEHVKSGRSADSFQPKGGRKANMERLKQAGAKAKEAIDRERAEATRLFDESMKSIAHYRDDLAKRRERVDGLRRLTGIEAPLPPFECETCELPKGIEA